MYSCQQAQPTGREKQQFVNVRMLYITWSCRYEMREKEEEGWGRESWRGSRRERGKGRGREGTGKRECGKGRKREEWGEK